jgi:FlaG/FlaF family flagellin (archaellin)
MRIVIALIGLALVAGCGDDDEQAAAPTPTAELTITVDKDGNGGAAERSVSVTCDAATDSKECAAVDGIKADTFEPVPADVACTQQYGGPETATVKGTLRGETIDAQFTRTNGCEISRWNAAADLLEAAG